MGYYNNPKGCTEVFSKTIKFELGQLIEPIENIPEEHIIYDYRIKTFMLASQATSKNLVNCWHFRTFTKKVVEMSYLLQKLNITKHAKLLDFLLQNIECPQAY